MKAKYQETFLKQFSIKMKNKNTRARSISGTSTTKERYELLIELLQNSMDNY